MTEPTDSELMRQVRAGRTGALATLFERHHARLYRYCLRMTGDRQASEDLVQDVFMRVLRYKATFKDDSSFVPWMFGIGRNACVAHLKRATADRHRAAELDDEPAATAADDESGVDHRQADLVRQALLALPADRREVLVLSRFEYKSYEEVAQALGCSPGAAKVRAHRAIKQLREIYLGLAGEAST